MKKLLALLLLCVLLTGCAAKPDIEGKWVTSLEDTLCATVLIIEGDRFTLIQAGRTSNGRWFYDLGTIALYEDVESPVQSGSMWSAAYDKTADKLILGELTLRRE